MAAVAKQSKNFKSCKASYIHDICDTTPSVYSRILRFSFLSIKKPRRPLIESSKNKEQLVDDFSHEVQMSATYGVSENPPHVKLRLLLLINEIDYEEHLQIMTELVSYRSE